MIFVKSLDFDPLAREQIEFWKRTNPKIARKILALLNNIRESPFSGIGKPELLKHDYSGCWSRRIDREHRLVYRVEKDAVVILSCRYHYTS